MWQGPGNPPVITQQPQGYNPQFPQQNPYGQYPGQPGPGGAFPQNIPMNQFPPQGGYPQGMYQQPGPYGPQPGYGQPMMGGMPMQNMMGGGGGEGMMQKVMGVLSEAVDVNPMSQMHSTGNILTGYRAPPLMPMAPVEGCPLGLEFLLGTEHVLVKQQIEKMEALLAQVGMSLETPNRYDVLNSTGQRIYFAAETGGLLGMQCSPSGSTRPFKIAVLDFGGRQILNIERDWSCKYCCLSCCNCCGTAGTEIKVTLGDGTYLGAVRQKFNWCKPLLSVEDDEGNRVAEIVGPGCGDWCCSCPGSCGCDVNFRVKTPDGAEIGQITKKWSGFVAEALTDSDNFGVSFPQDLEVRAKAMLLGAVFLIDFMFFEQNPNPKRND